MPGPSLLSTGIRLRPTSIFHARTALLRWRLEEACRLPVFLRWRTTTLLLLLRLPDPDPF